MLEFTYLSDRDTAKNTVKSPRIYSLSRNLTETQPSATPGVYHAVLHDTAVQYQTTTSLAGSYLRLQASLLDYFGKRNV